MALVAPVVLGVMAAVVRVLVLLALVLVVLGVLVMPVMLVLVVWTLAQAPVAVLVIVLALALGSVLVSVVPVLMLLLVAVEVKPVLEGMMALRWHPVWLAVEGVAMTVVVQWVAAKQAEVLGWTRTVVLVPVKVLQMMVGMVSEQVVVLAPLLLVGRAPLKVVVWAPELGLVAVSRWLLVTLAL
jgi:hypothetical protein